MRLDTMTLLRTAASAGTALLLAGGALAAAPAAVASRTASSPGSPASAVVTTVTAPRTSPTTSPRTSAAEARRVDRVPTPKLRWRTCYPGVAAQCASALLPLDYDRPTGTKVRVNLLRVKARKPKLRVGSLFVNPGGPGLSSTSFAQNKSSTPGLMFSGSVLDRFDIVGADPRGTGDSQQAQCFPSTAVQRKVYAGQDPAFPFTAREEASSRATARLIGRGCSTTGRPLSAAVSTAEVARDLAVLVRAVGDRGLTFFGQSYGTYLGQVYANLFPDRFRVLALDGVIDAPAWAGTAATAQTPLFDRLRSADGAWRSLRELLRRCAAAGTKAGKPICPFGTGDPEARLAALAGRLQAHPVTMGTGSSARRVRYSDMVAEVLALLYSDDIGSVRAVPEYFALLETLAAPRTSAPARAAAEESLRRLRADAVRPRLAATYDNYLREAFSLATCTDGLQPRSTALGRVAAAADRRAPYFGRLWAWNAPECATSVWTARDEDRYAGPFDRATAAPVLLVGSHWDPATNYDSAVRAARALPNSRLLSSDNWGHTAYGSSACATGAVDRYLITGAAPRRATCRAAQPYPVRP